MAEQQVDFMDAYLAAKALHSCSPLATSEGDFDRLGADRLTIDA